MEEKQILLDRMDAVHTTAMGADRIRKNLAPAGDVADPVAYCKGKILAPHCNIYKTGKNWYCEADGVRITVNARSYTIITAHKMRPQQPE